MKEPTAAARTMLVTVLDRSGRPTVDVGPDDFVIEEGNDEREVLSVQVADYPVIVMVDNAVDNPEMLEGIRTAVTRFIQRIGQRPVAIATLGEPPTFSAGFDDDRAAVLKAVDQIRPAADRTLVRPLAALTQAALRIAGLESSFSVVVVISTSPVDPLDVADADRVAPIVDSGAAVHVIALRPAGASVDSGPDLYRIVTDQTRGQFIPIFSSLSFGIALERLADALSMEIMIDYLVPAGSEPVSPRVGIRVPGARVRGLGVSR